MKLHTLIKTSVVITLFVLLAMWTLAHADIYGSSLTGWWTFDSNNMVNNVTDSSGNNNVGYLISATSTKAGRLAQANSFDGATSYVTIPSLKNNITYSAITVAFWFYQNGASTGNGRMVANAHTDAGGNGFQLGVGSISTCTGIIFDVGNSGADHCAGTGSRPATNKWVLIVGTYDGSTVKVYANGVVGGTTSSMSGAIGAANFDLGIGRNNSYAGDYITGYFDDVRLYNRALSASEVQTLYYQGVGNHGN